jgi:hypothetical protein
MPEESPKNYIQVEVERLRKDIKERFEQPPTTATRTASLNGVPT